MDAQPQTPPAVTLLPCPFCGEQSVGYYAFACVVRCNGCGAEGSVDPTRDQGREVAAELWNRRAPVDNAAAVAGELVAFVEEIAQETFGYYTSCSDPQCGDSTWDHDCDSRRVEEPSARAEQARALLAKARPAGKEGE